MELIKEIYDSNSEINNINYKIRKAARALVFNDSKIAILYVAKNNYHKLPGGGIEENENIFNALHREIKEEVGANVIIVDNVGIIIEYRNMFNQIQISYCYFTKVIGELEKPTYTEGEKENGFELKWVDLNEAIEILKHDIPNNYVGKFIQERDIEFLIKANEIVKNKI